MRVLERVWRKRKRKGGDRDNVWGGGDSIKKEKKDKEKRMAVMKRLKREII